MGERHGNVVLPVDGVVVADGEERNVETAKHGAVDRYGDGVQLVAEVHTTEVTLGSVGI